MTRPKGSITAEIPVFAARTSESPSSIARTRACCKALAQQRRDTMIRTKLPAVLAALLGMTAMASAQEWPTFRHDPRNTGRYGP